MSKKQKVLFIVAAVFGLSGIMALVNGSTATGGVGCIVIAAVLAVFGAKSGKSVPKEAENVHETPKSVQKMPKSVQKMPEMHTAAIKTIRTKVTGVSFENEDGSSRQDILSTMSGGERLTIEKYTFKGKPAAYVKYNGKTIGNLAADLAQDIERQHPNATITARALDITGGGERTIGCNIEIEIAD